MTRLPTDARQAELVATALQLAAGRSPSTITTADLAQAVGITQGAVFRHFPSKEAIWLAVIEQVRGELIERLRQAADAQPEPLSALRAVFLSHVAFVIEQPGVPRVIFQELQHPQDTPLKAQVRALMQDYRQLLVQCLRRAQSAGQLSAQADVPSAAVLFIGAIQGLVMQSLISGQVSAMRRQAPQVFDLLLGGLRAPSAHVSTESLA